MSMANICQSEGPRGETMCMLPLGHEGACGWELLFRQAAQGNEAIAALLKRGGALVGSASCEVLEIADAQARGDFFVTNESLGLVLRTQQWLDRIHKRDGYLQPAATPANPSKAAAEGQGNELVKVGPGVYQAPGVRSIFDQPYETCHKCGVDQRRREGLRVSTCTP